MCLLSILDQKLADRAFLRDGSPRPLRTTLFLLDEMHKQALQRSTGDLATNAVRGRQRGACMWEDRPSVQQIRKVLSFSLYLSLVYLFERWNLRENERS